MINFFVHLSKKANTRCGFWVAFIISSTTPFIPSATGNLPWARPSMACLNVGFWPGLNSKGTFRKDWGHAGPGNQWGKTTQMKKSEGNLLNANRNLPWTPHMSVVPARFSQASPTRRAESKGARKGERLEGRTTGLYFEFSRQQSQTAYIKNILGNVRSCCLPSEIPKFLTEGLQRWSTRQTTD